MKMKLLNFKIFCQYLVIPKQIMIS